MNLLLPKNLHYILYSIFFLNLVFICTAQDKRPDSLNNLLNTAKHDTTRFNAYMALGDYFQSNNPDTAIYFHNMAQKAAAKMPLAEGELREAKAIGETGWDFYLKGDYERSIALYNDAITLGEKYITHQNKSIQHKAKALEGISYGNCATVFRNQGNFARSLDYHFKAMEMNEEVGNKQSVAANLTNIGIVYQEQDNQTKALDYFLRSLKLTETIGNKKSQANNIVNIGNVYNGLGDHVKALEYHFRALKLYEELGKKRSQANVHGNIGNVYTELGDNASALDHYFKSLKICEEIGDKQIQAVILGNIGSLQIKQKKYADAERYLKQAAQINLELGTIYYLEQNYFNLSDLYEQTGRHKEALDYHKKHVLYRDSLQNEENQKALVQKEMQYEFDKKEAIARAEQKNKEELHKTELSRQTTQRNGFIAGFALMLSLAGISYRSYRHKKKANIIITQQKEDVMRQKTIVEDQKHLIEEKQKEIKDSITYAKRLQEAILAQPQEITKSFSDSFLLYKPKDIVAGDFYFFETTPTHIFYAAADCTGHGVPGALVSVVCSNALNRCVNEFKLTEPGKILDKTRELVLETFSKSSNEVKDGMDISFLCIHKTSRKVLWSGANNPLWYIHNNELHEIKADKQPIGKTDNAMPFTTHQIEKASDSVFYLFTDGYPDQFGGAKGKKFKYKQFHDLLLSNRHLSLQEQAGIIDRAFNEWKGDLEQVDDVCVIGLRI